MLTRLQHHAGSKRVSIPRTTRVVGATNLPAVKINRRCCRVIDFNKFVGSTGRTAKAKLADDQVCSSLHLWRGAGGEAQGGQRHASAQGSDEENKKKTAPETFRVLHKKNRRELTLRHYKPPY